MGGNCVLYGQVLPPLLTVGLAGLPFSHLGSSETVGVLAMNSIMFPSVPRTMRLQFDDLRLNSTIFAQRLKVAKHDYISAVSLSDNPQLDDSCARLLLDFLSSPTVQRAPFVQSLNLSRTNVSVAIVTQLLEVLTSLEKIALEQLLRDPPTEELEPLAALLEKRKELKKLQQLRIGGLRWNCSQLERICSPLLIDSKFVSVENISLAGCDLCGLNLSSLRPKTLVLDGCSNVAFSDDPSVDLQVLESLSLKNLVRSKGATSLSGLFQALGRGSHLAEIDLCGTALLVEESVELVNWLHKIKIGVGQPQFAPVQKLLLANTGMQWGSGIEGLPGLVKLDVGGNDLGPHENQIHCLLPQLGTINSLREVVLSSCNLDRNSIYALVESTLRNPNSQWTSLNLAKNNFGDQGISAVAELIRHKRTPTVFNLSKNRLTEKSGLILLPALRDFHLKHPIHWNLWNRENPIEGKLITVDILDSSLEEMPADASPPELDIAANKLGKYAEVLRALFELRDRVPDHLTFSLASQSILKREP